MTSFSDINRARSALNCLDAGANRESWVKIGMSAKAAGLDFEDFLSWSERAGNFKSEADCRSTWNSFKKGGVGAATLFHLARESGWRDDGEPGRAQKQRTSQKEQPSKPPRHDPETLWQACKPADIGHPYIAKKLGLTDGLRVYSGQLLIAGTQVDGSLVVPALTLGGELASLQFITPEKKLFLPGCKLPPDACFVIGGKLEGGADSVFVCEGIGQSWSAHQATGKPAVVCFGASRMAGVSDALAAAFPGARQTIVADAGKENQCEAIARKYNGLWVAMPDGSPGNYDLNDFHKEHSLLAVAELLAGARGHEPRLRLLSAADLVAQPPLRWRVRGVLPETGIAAIYGPSGSGKSFLVLDLLAAVAAGRPWFGSATQAASVLYVALEGEAGVSQRVKALTARQGPLAEGFHFLLQSLDIRKSQDRSDLAQALRATGWQGGLICIDTLNQSAPGMDENSSEDMGKAIAAIKAIQDDLGGMVLLVHHSGKDAGRGLRGHSSLHAALDAAIEVTRDINRREWRLHKEKDGSDGEVYPFRLEVVEIGQDEDDGEPVTSCVVVSEEKADDAVKRTLPPKSGNQRLIWDALKDLLKASTYYGQGGAPITRPCVQLEAAIEKTKGSLVCEPKRQTERTQAAITGLIARGLLTHKEGWLWVS